MRRFYDYYSCCRFLPDRNKKDERLILTKRDEKLLFLKLLLDRAIVYDEQIVGPNYPFPFDTEMHVKRFVTSMVWPEAEAKKLLANIDSDWKVYFSYSGGGFPHDYHISIETGNERQYEDKTDREMNAKIIWVLSNSNRCKSLKNFLLRDISGLFVIAHGDGGGVDYDSTRYLDNYILSTKDQIFLGKLEYPRQEMLKPGVYKITGKVVPTQRFLGGAIIKILIKHAKCVRVLKTTHLTNTLRPNLKAVEQYDSGIKDRITFIADKVEGVWTHFSWTTTNVVVSLIIVLLALNGLVSLLLQLISMIMQLPRA